MVDSITLKTFVDCKTCVCLFLGAADRICKERSDGIAFCSTFPIYFWQNASPIRLFDVAKKTSDLLVFFVVLLIGFVRSIATE